VLSPAEVFRYCRSAEVGLACPYLPAEKKPRNLRVCFREPLGGSFDFFLPRAFRHEIIESAIAKQRPEAAFLYSP
jgi:hypothetical protein